MFKRNNRNPNLSSTTRLMHRQLKVLNKELADLSLSVKKIEQSFDEVKRSALSSDSKSEAMSQDLQALLFYAVMNQVSPDVIKAMLPPLDLHISDNLAADIEGGSFCGYVKPPNVLRSQMADIYFKLIWHLYAITPGQAVDLLNWALAAATSNRAFICSEVIRYISYFLGGNAQLLLEYFKLFEKMPDCWDKKFALTWWFYIETLVRRGDEDRANFLLNKGHKIYSLATIHSVPGAALFAWQKGFSARNIEAAAFVTNELRKNKDEKLLFELFLKDKSVCLVGNGSLSGDLGRGASIDRHDTVFRFNDFVVSESSKANYGTKTDVWCSEKYVPRDHKFINPRTAILLTEYDGQIIRLATLEALAHYVKEEKRKIFYIDRDFSTQFAYQADYCRPSTGMMTLAFIKKLKPELTADSLHGFSFKEDGGADWGLHHQAAKHVSWRFRSSHSLPVERVVFRNLFER